MKSEALVAWINEALQNLGGKATLADIYVEVRRLGYDRGGLDLDKTIRSEIYKHSHDSTRHGGQNLFERVGGQRSGKWKLRIGSPLGLGKGRATTARLPELSDDDAEEEYQPQEGDQRDRVTRQICKRRGQRPFRDALMKRYAARCVVTGCRLKAVLEAAHIWPYRGEKENNLTNGLLLKTDIHTLFDLNLLGIEPETLRVRVHPRAFAEYGHLKGSLLRCVGKKRPSRDALQARYKEFLANRSL